MNTHKLAESMRRAGYLIWQSPPPGHRWALVKDADGVERYQAVPIECVHRWTYEGDEWFCDECGVRS